MVANKGDTEHPDFQSLDLLKCLKVADIEPKGPLGKVRDLKKVKIELEFDFSLFKIIYWLINTYPLALTVRENKKYLNKINQFYLIF